VLFRDRSENSFLQGRYDSPKKVLTAIARIKPATRTRVRPADIERKIQSMRYRITESHWLSIIRHGSIIIRHTCLLLVCGLCLFLSGTEQMAFAQQVFSASSTTETTSTLAAFRTAIGGADNSTNATPQTSGRREINWDAVQLDGTDFNNNTTLLIPGKLTGIPVNRFQGRGARFNRVLAVSNDGFASANPTIAGQFPAFSPANTFCSFEVTKDTVFVLASAPTTVPVPAATRGFGAIFLDVEKEHTSAIEYFNGSVSLGKFFVPKGANGETQFLGVLFSSPIVTRVALTTGTAEVFSVSNGQVISGGAESETKDLVSLDDFIYAEPVLAATSTSAASYSTTAFAAESISAVFGVDLTTTTASAASVPLPTTLAGASVKITDSQGTERLAPLFFVSPGQINYQVPPGTASGTALLTVTSSEGRINT
jgi:hypothetical protein